MHPDDFDADEWLALLGPLAESCAPPEEPDWANHPVYAEQISDAERVKQLLLLPAADRPTGELARIDARGLDPASRIDLLRMYDQQEQYVRAAQLRLLAEMDRSDSTPLGLSGELPRRRFGWTRPRPKRDINARSRAAALDFTPSKTAWCSCRSCSTLPMRRLCSPT